MAYTARMQLGRAGVEVIHANAYRRVRWRNGLGWTREIARMPAGDPFDWRMSIAEIGQAAGFSTFSGVARELVLLSGAGLRLRFADGREHDLLPPHARLRFEGEDVVQGAPLDGPATAFNLMWRRDAIGASLWRRPLVGAMVVFVDPGQTWAVHLLAGQAVFADGSGAPLLEAGDSALLRAGDGRSRCVLDGAGEALLVRLSPASTAPPP